MFENYLLLFRTKHWSKNLLVFVCLLFSQDPISWEIFFKTILVFLCFCFTSSTVYIFNDIMDKEYDAKHPYKNNRPIAKKVMSVRVAWACILISVIILCLLLLTLSSGYFLIIILSYLSINIAYTLFLRRFFPIGAVTIGIGFILRTLSGTVITKTYPPLTFSLFVFFTAMFLSTIKKALESSAYRDYNNISFQTSLKILSVPYINFLLFTTACIASLIYIAFTFFLQKAHPFLPFSSIFVIFGFYRSFALYIEHRLAIDFASFTFKDSLTSINFYIWLGCLFFSLYFKI